MPTSVSPKADQWVRYLDIVQLHLDRLAVVPEAKVRGLCVWLEKCRADKWPPRLPGHWWGIAFLHWEG